MSCACDFGRGFKTCHCAACHRTFTSVEAFDRHQRLEDGGIVCLDPATLQRRDGLPLYDRPSNRWAIARPNRVSRYPRASHP